MPMLNVTIGMTPEMLEQIDKQRPDGMSRAKFVREAIRDSTDTGLDWDPEEATDVGKTGGSA